MRKVILGLMLILAVSSCGKGIKAKGPITTKNIEIGTFDKVSVSDGLRLVVTMGDVERADVTAAESLHPYIEVYVRENTLHIGVIDRYWFRKMSSSDTPEIHVYAKSINDLEGSGGARIVGTNKITGSRMDVDISGGGYCECDMDVTMLDAEVSGGGKLKLSGIANSFDLGTSGGSRCECFDLITDNTNVDVSGGGVVQVTVNTILNVEASGGSRVQYKGVGNIGRNDISGGSSVSRVD